MGDFMKNSTWDEASFEKMINEYSTGLIKYCYSILGNYHDSQDAAQDAFLRIFYMRKSMKDPGAFKAYLYKTAYNICIDCIRRKKRIKAVNDRYIEYCESPEKDKSYISEELLAALQKLKPSDRALVYGIAVEERSFKEMSAILQRTESTLRKRYERAKIKLKDDMDLMAGR